MADALTVRRVDAADLPALLALRGEALLDTPLAFGSSPGDDLGSDEAHMRRSLAETKRHVVAGLFDGDRLVGMAGLMRSAKVKQRHRAGLYGMYVKPEIRGRGGGAALMAYLLDHARAWEGLLQVNLSVTDADPAARRLYERAGFRHWGTEPRSLGQDGDFVDEHHMVLTPD